MIGAEIKPRSTISMKKTGSLDISFFAPNSLSLSLFHSPSLFGMAVMPFLCRGVCFLPKLSYHRNCKLGRIFANFLFFFLSKKNWFCINGPGCLRHCFFVFLSMCLQHKVHVWGTHTLYPYPNPYSRYVYLIKVLIFF